jgi:Lrp/AsnC family transcriptional regulator, regulator for asnA, asnC and gidA
MPFTNEFYESDNVKLDDLDRSIINLLIKNAQMPYTEIAKRLIISAGTVHVRMRKLLELGIVKGSSLEVDYQKLGYDLIAYLGVYLEHGSDYEKVIEALKKIPEVTEAYFTTGDYSIFLKIYSKHTRHLYDLLNHKIQVIPNVLRTDTIICLNESINRKVLLE